MLQNLLCTGPRQETATVANFFKRKEKIAASHINSMSLLEANPI